MGDESRSQIIAIAGGTASGKTTLTSNLSSAVTAQSMKSAVVSTDLYFRRTDPSAPSLTWTFNGETIFDCNHIDSADTSRLAADLDGLRSKSDRPDVIFVEGLMVVASPEIRSRCDLTVYVDLEPDIRLGRRLLRDLRSERGFGEPEKIISYYLESARIGHERFVEPSKRFADLVVRGDAEIARIVDVILPYIMRASKGGCSRDDP